MKGTASKKTELSKRGKQPSTYRRIVTLNVSGKSIVQSDEQLQAYQFRSVPDYEHTLVWVNPTTPDLREEQRFDRYPDSVVPGPGGTSRHFDDVSAEFGLCGPIGRRRICSQRGSHSHQRPSRSL